METATMTATMNSTMNSTLKYAGGFAAARWLLLALSCAASAAMAQAPQKPLVMGILPNVSARVLLTMYQPFRDYLQDTLKMPVEIATAGDFRSFSTETKSGSYQLVVTAPNLGAMHQIDDKWQPVAIYEPQIPGILVSAADNSNNAVEQLRGKLLAVGNPQSLVVLRGLQWLRERGLEEGRDFRLTRSANEDSLGTLIRSGEAPLAMMSMGEFRGISENSRKALRVHTEFARVPGFLVMVNPALPATQLEAIRRAILEFPDTDQGREFFKRSGFAGIRALKAGELDALTPYVATTRNALKAAN
jgi:phosphonate transport system substrate-binding protein